MTLREKYQKEIVPTLMKEFALKNSFAVPLVKKVVINMGIGAAAGDKKIVEAATSDLVAITGQKPKVNLSRASIAGFKIRKGDPIGLMVTLRGKRMYDFMEKLFKIVLPRLRDFQGVSLKSFDGRGNYSLGLAEQIVFSEVDYAKVDKVRGLEITFVTSTPSQEQAQRLLSLMGMPFEKVK